MGQLLKINRWIIPSKAIFSDGFLRQWSRVNFSQLLAEVFLAMRGQQFFKFASAHRNWCGKIIFLSHKPQVSIGLYQLVTVSLHFSSLFATRAYSESGRGGGHLQYAVDDFRFLVFESTTAYFTNQPFFTRPRLAIMMPASLNPVSSISKAMDGKDLLSLPCACERCAIHTLNSAPVNSHSR